MPVSAIGCEDGVTMLADAQEIKRIPILGDRVAENARRTIPQARRWGFFWLVNQCQRICLSQDNRWGDCRQAAPEFCSPNRLDRASTLGQSLIFSLRV